MESTQCNKICSLFEKARYCNARCCKQYGHTCECICKVPKENHLCSQKCHLCEDYCNKPFDHENVHLCGRKHPCKNKCEECGYCRIFTEIRSEQKQKGSEIFYEYVQFQSAQKDGCNLFYGHSGIHSCGTKRHACGFRCKQCDYYCNEFYGHNGLHRCLHGKIKNFPMLFSYDSFKKDENKFSCDSFCREQGPGHIHYFESDNEISNNEVKFIKKNNDKYLYESKCSYYWENILKFEKSFIY